MTEHTTESIRHFITDCRKEERTQRPFSLAEEQLWDLAEFSPFEQTRIITTNEKVLADPYLMRVYLSPEREELELQLRRLGVAPTLARSMRLMPRPYLHYFFRGDDDRAFHNHPWQRSVSLILIGGYIEHFWDFELKRSFSRLLKPGSLNYLKRGTYHRVELLPGKKCWTLFVSTGRVQESDGYDWEFYDPETDLFTPHGEWTSADAERREFRSHAKVVNFTKSPYEAAIPKAPRVPSQTEMSELGDSGGQVDDPYAGHGGYDWNSLGRR